ncbi:hypothetical protein [Xanthovirga aplysinae]|uniref:hypothetical protein n=1 Tax=Xanthovirga aplysinae TaxID=2529853 RepID=UPI0012BB74C2|nr:hypothetical protein [Xanthovirga aplysinae]MTI30663.1 hypothetical protein [Xanthovirga aplysinae]
MILQKNTEQDRPFGIDLRDDIPVLPAAKKEMRSIQLGRRNMNRWQIFYLRGITYIDEKKDDGGRRKLVPQNDELIGNKKYKLAQEFNVGEATIERVARFASGALRFIAFHLDKSAKIDIDIQSGNKNLLKQEVEYVGQHQDLLLECFLSPKDAKFNVIVLKQLRKQKKQPWISIFHKSITYRSKGGGGNDFLYTLTANKQGKQTELIKTTSLQQHLKKKPSNWSTQQYKVNNKFTKEGNQQDREFLLAHIEEQIQKIEGYRNRIKNVQ